MCVDAQKPFVDIEVVCINCHGRFPWTAGEQQYFEQHGLATPKRCFDCRSARKITRRSILHPPADQPGADGPPSSHQQEAESIADAAVVPADGGELGTGWAIFLLCFLLPALLCAALLVGYGPTSATGLGVATTRVRLRTGPDTSMPILGVLDRGAQVTILQRVGDWLHIDHQGRVGFVHGSYVSVVAAEPTGAPPAGQARGLLPDHRRLLEETGWLSYVQGNIDLVEYYPWPGFQTPDGAAMGVAVYKNGQRIARVAMEDRDDVSIVATIVYDAACLAGIAQTGTLFGQDVSEELEERFLRDVRALREQGREGVSDAR